MPSLAFSGLVLFSAIFLAFAFAGQQQFEPIQKVLQSFFPASSQRPEVFLPQGKLVGRSLPGEWPHDVEAFLGFPYSQPPTGPRRFRPLEPLPTSNKTFEASDFGPICPGKSFRGPSKAYDEDCLSVNIFRAAGTNSSSNLPVALYVHGGAFNRGFAAMENIPSMLGWSESPFVGVSFSYRIGALGFLPSGLTEKEGLLNLGLRDMMFFFDWFRANIGEFGGNPEDVTVFGLSAGAHAIGHFIMNTDEPFFQRAMLESGATTARAVNYPTEPLHEQQFAEYITAAGCSEVSEDSIFDCLREKPTDVVLKASFDVFDAYNPSLRWAFQPSIDGQIIKRRPTESWETGHWHKIPILTGFCHNEAASYVPSTLDNPTDFPDYFRTLHPDLTDDDLNELSQLYPDPSSDTSSPYLDTRPLSVGAQYKRAEAAYGHYAYVCPVRSTARHASAGQDSPVYMYHWAANGSVQHGANHGDNNKYETYSPQPRDFSTFQDQLAGEVHAYWTSFITQKGDPNALAGRFPDRPKWLPFKTRSEEHLMIFGDGNDELAGGNGIGTTSQMVDDVWAEKECEWWWSKGEKLHQ
ncbi:alpha/beta-hydrolase [Saccharata proteae CBS 121410]|uniref:Carboxylic ester hydrolase n=1 Tax=Saccharata proteae CBS 121410 TaxID=1314787 RepID=A0A9P4HWH5_9PEZI|nr:alpha/beta-hydrolase [Saccharata proteae CBS 121410]